MPTGCYAAEWREGERHAALVTRASVLGCYLRELLLCSYSLWTRIAVL